MSNPMTSEERSILATKLRLRLNALDFVPKSVMSKLADNEIIEFYCHCSEFGEGDLRDEYCEAAKNGGTESQLSKRTIRDPNYDNGNSVAIEIIGQQVYGISSSIKEHLWNMPQELEYIAGVLDKIALRIFAIAEADASESLVQKELSISPPIARSVGSGNAREYPRRDGLKSAS